MTVAVPRTDVLHDAVRAARPVAAEHADAVDRGARFPHEAIAVLRDSGALSALVPATLGGPGASVSEIAHACTAIARSCSATGMVFAMHAIQVATLVRHGAAAPFFADHLAGLVATPRLLASVTSEIGTGGDMGRSVAALSPVGPESLAFSKSAPTVSYGAQADDLVTTVRRDESAAPGDQVLVLTQTGQHVLEPMGTWDSLGMRGTCSPGFRIRAELPAEQVLPVPF
ncbi:MAG: acyl-CoA dehydrogenase family protein, partial [Mycobacteriales bacterium]